MSYVKNHSYRDIPYSHETPRGDFSLYDNVRNLYAKCENNKDKVIKVRTVGIFKSENGYFLIKYIPVMSVASGVVDCHQCIHVSLAYMRKSVKSTLIPYPVQIIGMLQWKGMPVIFAQIIQPLKISEALLLQDTLSRIVSIHTCQPTDCDEDDKEASDI